MKESGMAMIITLTNADRVERPVLFDQMFQSRAVVFHDRLGWDVKVENGREMDWYDRQADPVYLLAIDDEQRVLGSLRLLATTGPTMLQSEFKHFFDDDVDVAAPTIWECTRFCVPPVAPGTVQNANNVSAELLIGLCELCLNSGIEFIVGVYETPMTRLYARIGWCPEKLAQAHPEIGDIQAGIWEASPEVLTTMRQRLATRVGGRLIMAA
jgi:acyl homoserine lactone synthase